ncbi:hypothetical protein HRH59_14740 [Rheinheimera sp. YQF-2]|uniref:Cthe-2314-like HEPN domain-containing protein n=1 Tax=Rheinheimera lutimaris TaxID=2740584 RepID=A0A7Y5ATL8_9GAMM|nr:hypothetical protein [Rheinheimera lutimaris]NRQ43809.1 hypothetical protein [Rheinheimera lutimaris]
MNWNKKLDFSSKSEIQEFEIDLEEFQKREGGPPFHWLKLSDLWCEDSPTDHDKRIFACVLDLRLNVSCLEVNLSKIVESANNSNLDTKENIYEAFRCFELNTSYITRYRSIFDKIMGLLVLIIRPEMYDSFSVAKKKKNKFVNIMSLIDDDHKHFATKLSESIALFDNKYRTAEVHGSGSVRKWNFEMIYGPSGNQADMFWSWNTLHPLLTALGKY